MKTTYTLYQWDGNKLISESAIPYPYDKYGEYHEPELTYAGNCDCISIRQSRISPYKRVSRIIECLYK
jgi:hypothetical protein